MGNFQHLRQFFGLGAEVQGDINGIQQGGGEVNLDTLVAVDLHGGYPVAGRYSQVGESVGQAVYPLLHLGKGKLLSFKQDCRAGGDDGPGDDKEFGSVHWVCSSILSTNGHEESRMDDRELVVFRFL